MPTPGKPTPERDEAQRLLAEAHELRRTAERERDRVRRLAGRFLRRIKRRRTEEQRRLAAQRFELDLERKRLAEEAEHFQQLSREFQTGSTMTQQRFRESWAELQAERKRAIEERAASEAFLREQHTALQAREADLARRQQRAADEKARFDSTLHARHKELDALDTRVVAAHAALKEAQDQRAALAASMVPEAEAVTEAELGASVPVPLDRRTDRDLLAWAAQLDQREQVLRRDIGKVKQREAAVTRAEDAVADQRRVVAEQFARLSIAQERWREAERRTIDDLEDLAHVLRRREREFDDRERDLILADRRRRQENYELWQKRLQLDGWRGVLTSHEAWWQTERNRQEMELAEQRARVTRRELAVGRLLVKWSDKLRGERDRLRAEIERWGQARARFEAAIDSCDQQERAALARVQHYASLSLALDETFRDTLDLTEDSGPARRFKTLRKRWEKLFTDRLRDIDQRIETSKAERQALNAIHRELHERSAEVDERNAASLHRAGEVDRLRHQALPDPYARPAPITNTEELAALRSEVERLAFVLMNVDWPQTPETPDARPLAAPRPPELLARAA